MKNYKFIAFDRDYLDWELFEIEEDAIKYCKDRIELNHGDGEYIGEEAMEGGIGYAKIRARSHWKVTDIKTNYTEEEWEENGYNPDWDEVGILELKLIR